MFDLGDEVFREILLPEELPPYTHDGFLCAYVSIYGNSIALFHYDYSSLRLNIWVMKHYGVVSSWTKALSLPVTYVARVRFGIRVRVRVRVRDSAIFEKSGCGCGGTRRLKHIFIYIFNILLNIFFHIIQTYTKFNVSEM